ncbi:hypothetical protein CR513_53520, partial [Mucuna pruriens]
MGRVTWPGRDGVGLTRMTSSWPNLRSVEDQPLPSAGLVPSRGEHGTRQSKILGVLCHIMHQYGDFFAYPYRMDVTYKDDKIEAGWKPTGQLGLYRSLTPPVDFVMIVLAMEAMVFVMAQHNSMSAQQQATMEQLEITQAMAEATWGLDTPGFHGLSGFRRSNPP